MSAPGPAPGGRLRVAHLLGVAELAGAELVGGAAGLDREIADVAVVHVLGDVETLPAGTLAVTAFRNPLGYELEVVARAGHARGLAGLVTTGRRRVLTSTRRMCDRLALPLVSVPDAQPVGIAAALARHVHDPVHLATARVLQVVRRLPAGATTAQILDALHGGLGTPVALVGRDRGVLAGAEDLPLAGVPLPAAAQAGPAGDGHLVLAPVTVDDPLRPDLWVAALLPEAPPVWVDGVVTLLRVVAFAVAAATARERVAGERDARDRSTLAAELMDPTRAVGRQTVERALRVGWRLDGWHTGVYLRLTGDATPTPAGAAAVADALRRCGLTGAFAERADGWVLWTTADTEPPSESFRGVRDAVAAALATVGDEVPLVAGVGRPYEGRGGIATTLQEAAEASLFAGARGPVEHVDGLGARRYLARWHQSEAFTSYAATLLAPLGGQDVLLDTLAVYLDRESSATATASHLGVHRNTVNQRIERVQQLLHVDLTRADDRLVVQLACRVLRGGH
ncbi:hypothetical protein BJF78_00360 [Pseudonocardia sp. CNS-139]|nr:hypothetical protein BJF78_00360 [Pseudonocardia sp. CNS-139]